MTHQSYKDFGAGSMSSTPHSSQHFPTSKAPSGHHCCLQVFILGCNNSDKSWYWSVAFSPVQSAPFTLLSVQALHPPVNWVFPLLGTSPWSCVAAYQTWTSSFCICLLCDRRHLKCLPKMNNQPLPLQSRGDLPTAVQKLGSNRHLKDRWIKNATDIAAENR